MKKLILIIILTINVAAAKAQQLPLYNQYKLNSFLINPAVAGSQNYTPLRIISHMNLLGFDNAPQTNIISFHSRISRVGKFDHTGESLNRFPVLRNGRFGIGSYLYSDKSGPFSRAGINFSMAYHLTLNDKKNHNLSIGISGNIYQFKIGNLTENEDYSGFDPTLTTSSDAQFFADLNAGILFYSHKYYFGISSAQILENSYKYESNSDDNKMVRHYFINGAYEFDLSKNFSIEPNSTAKAIINSPVVYDFGVNFYFKKNFWLGGSWSNSESFFAKTGFRYKNFIAAYFFGYSLSNIVSYSSGIHEILIGFNFNEKKRFLN